MPVFIWANRLAAAARVIAVLAGLAAAALVLALLLRPALAQTVYCVNCGSEFTQLANYAQLINQLAKQAGILQTNINQYQVMTLNSTPLTQQQWGSAANDIRATNTVLSQAQSLSYLLGTLDAAFAKKYSNYNTYVSGTALNSQTMAAKYQQWSADTNSSVATTLKAAGTQSAQITGAEDQLLQSLQSQATGANGQLQALQVANEVSVQTVRQLQKLRQLVLMDTQLKANFIQTQSDKEAAQQAAWKQFVKPPAGY
jgi:P-type conjugative transfer protein TrbJ